MYKKAIIAPLNWGLGHATRCIPIIQSLLHHHIEVVIASDGEALDLLRLEFPQIRCYKLPSYQINYRFTNPVTNMFWHSRNFIRALNREHKEFAQLIKKEKPDLIISDNRYGVHSKNIFSVFISHQIKLQTGYAWLDPIASNLNRWLLKPFDHIWIPDFPPPQQLAPKLSAPPKKSHTYIGILSRLEPKKSKEKYDLCGIISGPEPQRTKLEYILTEQMQQVPGNHILIRGKTQEKLEKNISNVKIVSYMTSSQLNEVMNESKIIVARSGYSTIMDLIKTGKKAILIPTPGQPEQIYLAKSLKNHPNFEIQQQHSLNLSGSVKSIILKEGMMMHLESFDMLPFLEKIHPHYIKK